LLRGTQKTGGDFIRALQRGTKTGLDWRKVFYKYGKEMSDKTLLFVVFVISTIVLIYVEYFTDGF